MADDRHSHRMIHSSVDNDRDDMEDAAYTRQIEFTHSHDDGGQEHHHTSDDLDVNPIKTEPSSDVPPKAHGIWIQ